MGSIVPVLALLFLSCLEPSLQQGDEETDSLPLTPQIASVEMVEENSSACSSTEVLNVVKDALEPLVVRISDALIPCTSRVKGQVSHCPASNCTELFNLAQEEGLILLSNYYWLVGTTGEARKIYCDRDAQQLEYSSCEELFELNNLPSGTYTIRPSGGSPVTVYCDMDSEECGGGVWTRVASYDYSDPSISCPNTWTQINSSFRGCAFPFPNYGCFSAFFPTLVEFSQVCGKVIGIQHATTDGFTGPDDINNNYVEGVSITHGSPRQHIWSFAAYPFDTETNRNYLCPCSNPSLNVPPPPSFVGNNYFCDTGVRNNVDGKWHTSRPLWDGQGCPSTSTCCSFNNPPWFSTTLPQSTTDDIEVRICHHDTSPGDDYTAITQLDLYIK